MSYTGAEWYSTVDATGKRESGMHRGLRDDLAGFWLFDPGSCRLLLLFRREAISFKWFIGPSVKHVQYLAVIFAV